MLNRNAVRYTYFTACERYEEAIEISLAEKSVPENAVGKIEVENCKVLAAFNNS